MSLISFYTPWKHQRTFGFLMFSAGIERDRLHEIRIFEEPQRNKLKLIENKKTV